MKKSVCVCVCVCVCERERERERERDKLNGAKEGGGGGKKRQDGAGVGVNSRSIAQSIGPLIRRLFSSRSFFLWFVSFLLHLLLLLLHHRLFLLSIAPESSDQPGARFLSLFFCPHCQTNPKKKTKTNKQNKNIKKNIAGTRETVEPRSRIASDSKGDRLVAVVQSPKNA